MAATPVACYRLTLPNSAASVPRIGFGVYKIRGPTCLTAVSGALSVGYRHIDSAALYRNEHLVREAVDRSGLARKDVFLTTKVGSPTGRKSQTVNDDDVYRASAESVNRMAGEDGYVDLLLIHVPGPSRAHRERLWAAMERLKEEGRTKSIGTHGIIIEAYSPLATGSRLDEPTLHQIATKHHKTPAQILIRYALQKGWVPLPKSAQPHRIRQNFDVFSFEIDADDMTTLDALDEGSAGAVFRMNVD
ncbi:members of the aldo keto reductase family [Fusarium albosuccineum]|uniref:Members of the aldo keto reductase family n=1 Tax=Fusarium albosuccineum TaxID=1237068 RepID=A0A8H4PB54_9HYPO|nr:members of the aldo keto reductase family [Fusarium albosuccineum]